MIDTEKRIDGIDVAIKFTVAYLLRIFWKKNYQLLQGSIYVSKVYEKKDGKATEVEILSYSIFKSSSRLFQTN